MAVDVETLLLHRDFVRSLARRLVVDENEADEVVQETWMVALRRPPGHGSSPRSWLATVVRSQVANRFRGHERRSFHEGRRHDAPREAADPRELLATEQLRDRLSDALGRLDDSQRDALVLRYLEDLPPRKIASRLGCPVETVRTRVKRGLARLRDDLDREFGGDRSVWANSLLVFAGLGDDATPAAPVTATPSVPWLWVALPLALVGGLVWFSRGGGGAAVAPGAGGVDFGAALAVADGARDGARLAAPGELVREPAGLGVRARWRGTAEPAVGVAVRVTRAGGGGALTLVTDAGGRAAASGLEPGAFEVAPDRGPPVWHRVEAGRTLDVELELPRGVALEGFVRDPEGRAVRGAEIRLSWPDRPDERRTVARSDADGRFALEGIDPRCWVRAVHRGGGTELRYLGEPGRDPGRPLTLTLDLGRAGLLAGHVRDAEGGAIEGAEVESMYGSRFEPRIGLDGALTARCATARARTDDRGRFEVAMPTRYLNVTASGFAAASSSASPQRTQREIEVVLGPPAAIAGRVVDAAGRPARGADVIARPARPWEARSARTDADGGFRFDDLPATHVDLEVVLAVPGPAGGVARARIELAGGEAARWEAALDPDALVRGTVFAADGEPARGWRVTLAELEPEGALAKRLGIAPSARRWALTDDAGRFALPRPASGRAFEVLAFAQPDDVRPDAWCPGGDGGGELELRAGVPSGSLVGRAPLLAGGDLLVVSRRLAQPLRLAVDRRGGGFDSGPLPAGRFELWGWAPGSPLQRLAVVEVEDGRRVALGELDVPAPGSLEVRATLPGGFAPGNLRVELRSPTGAVAVGGFGACDAGLSVDRDGTVRVPELPADEWSLSLRTRGHATIHRSVRVEPGRAVVLDLEFAEPHVQQPLRVSVPALDVAEATLVLTVRDSAGEVAHRSERRFASAEPRVLRRSIPLAPGTYRLDAHVPEVASPGLAAAGELVVLPEPERRELALAAPVRATGD